VTFSSKQAKAHKSSTMAHHRSHDTSLRVQYLNIQLLRPDPVQPRRILPHDLHTAFHSQQISPNQALRELVNRVHRTCSRSRSDHFSNPFELIGDVHNEEASSSEADYSLKKCFCVTSCNSP
jgi:hypothetical protein